MKGFIVALLILFTFCTCDKDTKTEIKEQVVEAGETIDKETRKLVNEISQEIKGSSYVVSIWNFELGKSFADINYRLKAYDDTFSLSDYIMREMNPHPFKRSYSINAFANKKAKEFLSKINRDMLYLGFAFEKSKLKHVSIWLKGGKYFKMFYDEYKRQIDKEFLSVLNHKNHYEWDYGDDKRYNLTLKKRVTKVTLTDLSLTDKK